MTAGRPVMLPDLNRTGVGRKLPMPEIDASVVVVSVFSGLELCLIMTLLSRLANT